MDWQELEMVVFAAVNLTKTQCEKVYGDKPGQGTIAGPIAAALVKQALCDDPCGLHIRELLKKGA